VWLFLKSHTNNGKEETIMSFSFEGKAALVTGAGSGMGLATARAFALAGASVVLADINGETVKTAADHLMKEGHKAVAVCCDVSNEQQVKEMVNTTIEKFGRLDAAFNNAGIQIPMTDTADLAASDYDLVMGVNLRGVWLCMKYELLCMRGQGYGTIVNCSSLGGLVGGAGRSAYHAAKHGVLGLTKCAAIEYAPRGIRINAVCPGTIDTPMVHSMIESGDLSKEAAINLMPIGRLGREDEIADAVLWLSSPMSSFVIGQAISVDGGYTIQ
jgi:NAD(P)-dependent dehydrogenase (short-subunit alcohol dehydrogenase family)